MSDAVLRVLRVVGFFVAFGLVVLALRCVFLAVSTWLRLRAARLEAERDPFPNVHTADEGERRNLVCLDGGKRERVEAPLVGGPRHYRRAYQGRQED